MLDILDAVLATAAVILGLSLLVQAAQQIFKQSLELKSEYMRDELLALFNTTGRVKTVFANIRRTSVLARQADDTAKRIVRELEEKVAGFGFSDLHLLEHTDAKTMKKIIGTLPISGDKSANNILGEAMHDFDHWFDISKQAFQEHYERRMKYWSFVLSLLLVIAVNANLFDVYREFSVNKSLRDAAIAMGERFIAAPRDSLLLVPMTDSTIVKNDTLIRKEMERSAERISSLVSERSFQIMGWTRTRIAQYEQYSVWAFVPYMLFGWLGMTLLVSLGAPFWYDLLKMVMGIKNNMNSKK